MKNLGTTPITAALLRSLPADVHELAATAHAEGFFMLDKLIHRYVSGENRFERPGEALFAAKQASRLVGIGGLNVDPYFDDSEIGRVRHLYIHPLFRRHGAGRLIVETIEAHAAPRFRKLQLFTPTDSAARFYEALGYTRVSGQAKVSHVKPRPESAQV